MKVLVLGGSGFLGKRLVKSLLEKESLNIASKGSEKLTKLVLFDTSKPTALPDDDRLECLEGDICDKSTIKNLLAGKFDLIFHLAAIVSGEAEKKFELGMDVNLEASLFLLEECRQSNHAPVLVFASSCAVFGGLDNKVVEDHIASTPKSSYGTQKAIVELLINDYSRRGFVDGRSLRLPTIAIRPGSANAATSSFASAIVREPLHRQTTNCPVSKTTQIWILSPRKVTDHFLHAASIDGSTLGANRIITLPGLTTSVHEMCVAMDKLSEHSPSQLISWERDPFIESIVHTWPTKFKPTRALQLGFKPDSNIEEIIGIFMEEEL